jgi:DNA-directed RNA polymerase specialized sigma24 family protein
MDLVASNWPTAELVKRCSRRPADDLAWQEFVRRFHSTIVASVSTAYQYKLTNKGARATGSSRTSIDDLVQKVYCRLVEGRSHTLNCFEADQPGSIYDYVAIISYRIVFSHTRAH